MELNDKLTPYCRKEFCKAVTGYSNFELLEIVSNNQVNPIDEELNLSIGRDMPRSDDEELVDKFEIFMNLNCSVQVICSYEELYEAFKKYSSWEKHIHPRDRFPMHENYWDPTYEFIEKAYLRDDKLSFKEGISVLIDQILHD